jgi:hypothetical protein
LLKTRFANGLVSGHDFSRAVNPFAFVIPKQRGPAKRALALRGVVFGFGRRGICCSDFFRSLFTRAVGRLEGVRALAPEGICFIDKLLAVCGMYIARLLLASPMFERYKEKARGLVFFARYEASQFGSPYIETEHLLLGLLREDKALTNRFLRSYASVESIRRNLENYTTVREHVSTSVDLPLSNECKRILAYAAEESRAAWSQAHWSYHHIHARRCRYPSRRRILGTHTGSSIARGRRANRHHYEDRLQALATSIKGLASK